MIKKLKNQLNFSEFNTFIIQFIKVFDYIYINQRAERRLRNE